MADETKNLNPNEGGGSGKENKGNATGKENKSKLKAATPIEEGTVIGIARLDAQGGKTDNYIWIEGTGESRHLLKGKKFEVQRQHAEKLISKGAAKETTAPPKPQPKPIKKKTDDDEED